MLFGINQQKLNLKDLLKNMYMPILPIQLKNWKKLKNVFQRKMKLT